MKYSELFEKFWEINKNSLQCEIQKNTERTYKSLMKQYIVVDSNPDKDIDFVDKYIKDKKSTSMQKMHLKFCKYLEKVTNNKYFSSLENRNINITPIERRLDILKESHGYFKISEFAEKYDVDQSTINDDIKKIENGIKFMGTEINPTIICEKTKKRYEDTVHPVFLALNLTEVNTLMKILPEILNEIDSESLERKQQIKMINSIIERMKFQLSDYACKRIKIERKDIKLKFISEKDIVENEDSKLCFLCKGMTNDCTITLNGINEYVGRIIKYEDYYAIETTNGEIVKIEKEDNVSYKTE